MKDRFHQLIVALGISQNEFCRRAGLPQSTISLIDKGPRADSLAAIAIAFPTLNIRWLLTGSGDMFYSPNTFDEDWYKSQIEIKDKQIAFLMDLCQKGAAPQSLSQSINL